MRTRITRLALLLLVMAAPLVLAAPPAQAFKLPFFGLFDPPPPPTPVIPPVAAKLTRDPVGPVRGTVILVHAGGWAGHDSGAQQILFEQPGNVFLERGWRVVSIDYDEGTAGLQDVLSAVGDELARGTTTGPLCLYGESAGAQLAIVAAARLRSIDCVIGLGTPTDLALYEAQGATSDNAQVRLVASRMDTFFGTTPAALGPWDPVALAPTMRADVLLVDEADDGVVSVDNAARFQAVRPTTQTVVLESGDPNDPSTKFVHGTVSAAGRAEYEAAIGAFADRMAAANDAERAAARTGCARVNRTLVEVPLATLQTSLGCLARRDAVARRGFDSGWRSTTIRLRGELDAARIWARLRGSMAGRRALAALVKGRASLSVAVSDRSRVTLRRRADAGAPVSAGADDAAAAT